MGGAREDQKEKKLKEVGLVTLSQNCGIGVKAKATIIEEKVKEEAKKENKLKELAESTPEQILEFKFAQIAEKSSTKDGLTASQSGFNKVSTLLTPY